jgi:hypothetical protein
LRSYQKDGLSRGRSVGSAFVAPSVEAVIITLNGQNYTVETFKGSYSDNESLLTSQPWWGNSDLAFGALSQVEGELGFPNNTLDGIAGPLFAFDFSA